MSEEGCTRWQQFDAASKTRRAARCSKTASDKKCACGHSICRRCVDNWDDVWQTCEKCDEDFGCSSCVEANQFGPCAVCDMSVCGDCSTSCADCGAKICTGGDCDINEIDGNVFCEQCGEDLADRDAEADEDYREQMREVYGDGLENLYGDDADAWRLAKEIAPGNAEAQARIVPDAKRHREEESDALFGRRTRKRTKYGDSDDSDNYD